MNCIICKVGTTEPGKKTLTFERDAHIVLVKNVPCGICTNCGYYYADPEQAKTVLEQVRRRDYKAELEVLQFGAL